MSTASLILPWLNGNQKNFNNNHFPEQTTNRTQTVKKKAQAWKKESASREKRERKQGKNEMTRKKILLSTKRNVHLFGLAVVFAFSFFSFR